MTKDRLQDFVVKMREWMQSPAGRAVMQRLKDELALLPKQVEEKCAVDAELLKKPMDF